MRVALATTNPLIGDLEGNGNKIIEWMDRAKGDGAELIVFPELALVGYPPKDLLLKTRFIADNLKKLEEIATRAQGITAVVGYVDRNAAKSGRELHNAAAVLRDGKVTERYLKLLLPTYDVFDESRYFEPGPTPPKENRFVLGNASGETTVGLTICEDLWNDERLPTRRLYHRNPVIDMLGVGVDMLINASASPFVVGKQAYREKLFASQVRQIGKPLIYVNQVGGNDELVFDGCAMVFDGMGNLIFRGKPFEEELVVVDVPQTPAPGRAVAATKTDTLAEIFQALVLGLRDYARKTGFTSVVLGLSGGIDSALVAAIAVAALGADKVTGVAMPSRYSSEGSVADARALAQNLGVAFHVIPIGDVHNQYEAALAPTFAGLAPDVTEENLQARIRGAMLMAMSNKFGTLLLTTGNKSEIATGYCTLYGDMCGGLALISDVPKTTVWDLSRWINTGPDVVRATKLPHRLPIIPSNSIEKPPSAELRPDQTDQDSLPPYPVLDSILLKYIEEEKSAPEIVADGFDPALVSRVIRLVDRSEYKRRQAAPGIKVTSRAFGFGRRMPIAMKS